MKLRISLKAFFILIAVVALISATLAPPMIERRHATHLSGAGVQLLTEPRGQFFVRQIAGDAFASRVVYVHLSDPQIDDNWLEKLRQFPYIETISIKSSNITDAGLKHFENLPNLISLNLVDTQTTPAGIEKLRQSTRKLIRLEAYPSLP